MLRQFEWIPLLLCCSLPGCMAPNSIAVRSNRPAIDSTDALPAARNYDFDLDQPAETQMVLAARSPGSTRDLLMSTPRGSLVSLVDNLDCRYMGTLLSADPEELELMNCVCREVVPGPNGQRQCKTSHVPFQSLKTSSMTHLIVISPPSPDSDSPEDSRDLTVDALVFKSGRLQRWGKPPERAEIEERTDAAAEE